VKKRNYSFFIVLIMTFAIMSMAAGCGGVKGVADYVGVKGAADYVFTDAWNYAVYTYGANDNANYISLYNNKIIEVKGSIWSIDNKLLQITGQTILVVRDEGGYIRCIFDAGNNELANYHDGDLVTIHGYFRASTNITDDYKIVHRWEVDGPVLLHCQFITN